MPDDIDKPETSSPAESAPAANRLPTGRRRWLRVLVWYPLIALVAYIFATQIIRPPLRGGLRPGATAPRIVAEGWLNGPGPSPDELRGKVIVVDAWFAACPPCRKKAPELVKTYRRFSDRDVVFLGLTPDGEQDLPDCRVFLESAGITWPNGYGAIETLQDFLTDGGYFPSLWVIDRDGKVVWNSDSSGTLEEAIEQALSAERK